MISDAAGNSYVAVNQPEPGSIVILDLDGTLQKSLTPAAGASTIVDIEPASPSGFLLAQTNVDQVTKYDALAQAVFTARIPAGLASVAADSAGNTYAAGANASGIAVYKLDGAGHRIAAFQSTASGTPTRMAVDSTGAVYLVGHFRVASNNFPTTPGAFMEADSNSDPSAEHGFAMKISAGLDSVVYATLLAGWQTDGATSLAVDNSGAAYIGGAVSTGSGTPSPLATALTWIGSPLTAIPSVGNVNPDTSNLIGYVIKLNSSGSNLIYGAALCAPCAVDGIILAPDGRVHAVAENTGIRNAATLFTLSAAGDHVERCQTLNGVIPPFAPTEQPGTDLAMGANGSIRVLGHLGSSDFPVTYTEGLAPYPAVFELPAQAPTSDIQVGGSFPYGTTYGPRGPFRVTVTNLGPADAESVEVHFPVSRIPDDGVQCTPNISAAVYGFPSPMWAVIPKIAPGAQVSIDCGYGSLDPFQPNPQQFDIPIEVSSLSSDTSLTDNYTRATGAVGSGQNGPALAVFVQAPSPNNIPLVAYSSVGGFCTGLICSHDQLDSTQFTSLFPEPQRWRGNLWYFDSWGDGVNVNPRTFTEADNEQVKVLSLRTAQAFGVDPPSLDFVAGLGLTPKARSVTLYPSFQAVPSWSVADPGVSWLKIDPLQTGHDDVKRIDYAILTAEADSTGLAPGAYTATIPVTLTAADQTTSIVNVPVSLRVTDQAPAISAVEDSASHRAIVSPGQVVTILGSGLAPNLGPYAPIPAAGEPLYTIGGTSVVIGGERAQLLYVGEDEVVAIVPELSVFATTTDVTVDRAGVLSASMSIGLANFAPSLFTLNEAGSGPAIAINTDGSVNSPLMPAARGSVLSFYGTGFFGQSSSVCAYNFVNPLILEGIDAATEVTVGGKQAFVLYAGIAPGLVCGMQEMYIIIPDDAPAGNAIPLKLRTGEGSQWYETQDNVTIAVR